MLNPGLLVLAGCKGRARVVLKWWGRPILCGQGVMALFPPAKKVARIVPCHTNQSYSYTRYYLTKLCQVCLATSQDSHVGGVAGHPCFLPRPAATQALLGPIACWKPTAFGPNPWQDNSPACEERVLLDR